ncbi:MAG: helicase-associated domain-containing protein, partial [Agromyces sp.]
AWLARQLEAAARSKETLTVTVRMPGGDTADYLLAPASVANGRLRARDRKADIERTLPLSAIAAVSPAPAGT